MGRLRKGRTVPVWVIMHYEFMGTRRSLHIDSVQFHVSSSLAKAEEYIRTISSAPHGWWQVHLHVVDDDPSIEGQEVHYYSYRGKRLKSPPLKRAKAAFDKLPDSRIGP